VRRGRREERREERRGGEQQIHYQMRQRLMSIGDDFWIESDRGERAYKIDGKALRLRKTLIFEDPSGRELAKIQEKVARIKDTMEIEDPDGHTLATVKKALITPMRERWVVKIEDGPDLDIQGNILDHEYTFTEGRTPVATVSKRWFRVADSYGVEIAPGQNPVVILAATVALDAMAHPAR
jgi:uncharacterized protein YxjI